MLEGTLDTFTLPDIFQLLAFTKKSGCLVLEHDREEGKVWFDEGQVHYAVASTGRLALGKRLVGAGVVTAEQLQQALDAQQGSRGVRLGNILVEQGALDQDTLEEFLREQIQDSVFDLMRWSDGAFRFDHEDETDEEVGLTVTVENLIMEGSRRIEEWDTVRNKIPGRNAVVAMVPSHEGPLELNLEAEEWRLLAMVDGRRTVGDLIELSGQGEFQTCKLLYGLVGAGLLEVRDPDVHGPPSIAALLAQQELLRQMEQSIANVDRDVVAKAAKAEPVTAPPEDEVEEADSTAEEPEPEPETVPEPAAEEPAEPTAAETETEVEAPAGDSAVTDVEELESPEVVAGVPVADEEEPVGRETEVPEGEPEPKERPAAASQKAAPNGERRIKVDPSIDAALLDRLISGVKAL